MLFVLGCVLCLFCFGRLPTLSRCRSFLPDLMTVRAVMVRAALEEKKSKILGGAAVFRNGPPFASPTGAVCSSTSSLCALFADTPTDLHFYLGIIAVIKTPILS